MSFKAIAAAILLSVIGSSAHAFADPETKLERIYLQMLQAEIEQSKAVSADFDKLTDPVITSCNTDGKGTIQIEIPIGKRKLSANIKSVNGRVSLVELTEPPAASARQYNMEDLEYKVAFNTDDNTDSFKQRLQSASWLSPVFKHSFSGPKEYMWHQVRFLKQPSSGADQLKLDAGLSRTVGGGGSFAVDLSHGLAKALPNFWDKTFKSCADGTAAIGTSQKIDSATTSSSTGSAPNIDASGTRN